MRIKLGFIIQKENKEGLEDLCKEIRLEEVVFQEEGKVQKNLRKSQKV